MQDERRAKTNQPTRLLRAMFWLVSRVYGREKAIEVVRSGFLKGIRVHSENVRDAQDCFRLLTDSDL